MHLMARDDYTPPANESEPVIGNATAEAVLVGTLMLMNSLIDPIADILAPEDFSDEWTGNLFSLIVKEHSLGRTANPITLKPYFNAEEQGIIAGLTGSGATAIAAKDYAEQIRDLAKRRRLLKGLAEARDAALDHENSSDQIAAIAEAALAELQSDSSGTSKDVTAAEAILAHMKAVENGLPPGVLSNIGPLDHAMGPIRPGDLQIIAGRPGMGKSILAMSIAKGAALDGHGALFVSLEMKADQLGMRLAADLCFDGQRGINFDNIRDGRLTAEQHRQVNRAADAIREMPLIISPTASLRVGRLNTLIRRWKRRFAVMGHPLELVVVDYLQLMDADRQSDNRTAEITQISRGLKMAALANDVGIVALAQLNRAVEQREEKRPKLSDLRESGSIEQDADGVLFLYRDEYYLRLSEPPEDSDRRDKWESSLKACEGEIEFICAKRRQGETGIRRGRFYGAFQTVRA